jgi:hypothetical protein
VHAKPPHVLFLLGDDSGEFVVRGYLLGGDLVVVGQTVLLCATCLALLAANAHRGVV